MPRDSPPHRSSYRNGGEESSSRYRDSDRRDRYSRDDDGANSHRDRDRERGSYGSKYDDNRDRDRDRDQDRRRRDVRDRDPDDYKRGGRDRDHDRNDRPRERERERERDDEPRRAGPSRRSASPPSRRTGTGSRAGSAPGDDKDKEEADADKAKPNFGNSGLLAAETKQVRHADGTKTVLKYHEPPEARKPAGGWRLYVFKGKEQVDLLHIQRQSAYLVGRDKAVVDIAVEHPSCSKQHAVIQYRQVQEKNEFGDVKAVVKPYIIDLESTNGTIVNDAPIPTSRYCELMLGDVIKFGESAREYVLLSEDAA